MKKVTDIVNRIGAELLIRTLFLVDAMLYGSIRSFEWMFVAGLSVYVVGLVLTLTNCKFGDRCLDRYGTDKILHFLLALCLILIGGHFGDIGIGVSLICAVLIELLKEFLDAREKGNKFDMDDLIWGVCGNIFGVILYVTTLIGQGL